MPEPQVSPQAPRRPRSEPQAAAPQADPEAGPPAPDPASPAAPPPSNLERLKEQYEAATEDRHTTIQIAPGRFSGNLAARYRPIPWTNTRKQARKAARGGFSEDSELNYAAGQLAKACETILIRMEEGGDFIPMHEANERWRDGQPVRYDSRLCEALGIDLTTGLSPSAIVRLVFKHPHALNAHFVEFDQWLKEQQGSDDDEDEDADPEEELAARPT